MSERIEKGFDQRILNYRITLQYRFKEITLRYTSTERLSHHRMLLYPYPQKYEATTTPSPKSRFQSNHAVWLAALTGKFGGHHHGGWMRKIERLLHFIRRWIDARVYKLVFGGRICE
ncbi:unnamed protein product [Sphenostylis stenocarpa]|uniref:Uncharacterized protein n=1 Tax=Sphenostylis stenocarpa TaxID=92480 RepID=A0AA86VUK1_9FABA|nr:unnamed protein product [Sphenostylis stenocarpa]